jgi:hypothetical protein
MKLSKMVLIGAAVLGLAGLARTAGAADPVVGTWTLNTAKSTFDAGQAPKSQTRTYTEDSDGINLTVNGINADGSALSEQSTFKYDGRAYPITGAPDYDALSLRRVNGSTVTSTHMKGGKKVGVTTRSISAHGNVLTLSSKISGADGKVHNTVMVFDKQ